MIDREQIENWDDAKRDQQRTRIDQRAELAQVHDLYARLARTGATIGTIRETAERAAAALREGKE